MKRFFLCFLLLLPLLWLPGNAADAPLRGIWVSTVYNLDYPSAPGMSAQSLRDEADAIIQNAKNWGLNAIFLQVRPCGDALYASDTQPWSAVLSGKQGQAPDAEFDPLEYFIQECHTVGIQLHAWLNPYRITRSTADSYQEALAQLSLQHPAHEMEDCLVLYSDGCLYLDPGRPEVRQHLTDIVQEILEKYAVDGIHLDDYFYPGTDFADDNTYLAHRGDLTDIGDFRRQSVDQLIEELHRLTNDCGRRFGVSPAGIWATAQRHPLGVDTSGSQSYFDHYADSRRWVRENMVDYIAPQIYWEIGAQAGDFSLVLDWWAKTTVDTDVDLYIGLAAYKSAQAQPDSVWYGEQELLRQMDALEACPQAAGMILFRYGSVKGSALAEHLTVQPAPEVRRPAPVWPDELQIGDTGIHQSVLSGKTLSMQCTAYRGSRVWALYGSDWQHLKPDLNGGYGGTVTAQAPHSGISYTAPALIGTEKNGILFIKLTPFTITSVAASSPVAIQDITWEDTEVGHQIIFHTKTPAAASFSYSGDVASLCFSPCELGVLFNDHTFDHMEVLQKEQQTLYRFVYPDDGQRRQHQLLWEPDKITLVIKKTLQEPPVPDQSGAE